MERTCHAGERAGQREGSNRSAAGRVVLVPQREPRAVHGRRTRDRKPRGWPHSRLAEKTSRGARGILPGWRALLRPRERTGPAGKRAGGADRAGQQPPTVVRPMERPCPAGKQPPAVVRPMERAGQAGKRAAGRDKAEIGAAGRVVLIPKCFARALHGSCQRDRRVLGRSRSRPSETASCGARGIAPGCRAGPRPRKRTG
mmetsp:Transcript_59928/g.173559  ORF Transcript_59928/g.173559 Transcript_59928/m.173559 type:complete len:200 (-) Transcript_59928:60-659(-)